MSDIANETYLSMLSELKTESIDSIGYKYLAESDHRFLKDLKINIQNTLNFENLSKKRI